MLFAERDFEDRNNNYPHAVAKLRRDVSLDQARAETSVVAAQRSARIQRRTRAPAPPYDRRNLLVPVTPSRYKHQTPIVPPVARRARDFERRNRELAAWVPRGNSTQEEPRAVGDRLTTGPIRSARADRERRNG